METPNIAQRPIRLLIADDHRILRQGLIALFQCAPDLEVVGEAADGEEAVQKAAALAPDIVVMDVSMPRMDGLEATKKIKAQMPETEIIVLTLHESQDIAETMCEAGAGAYFSKSAPLDRLVECIRSLSHHQKSQHPSPKSRLEAFDDPPAAAGPVAEAVV